jgi:hypothetical protein
MTTSLSTTTKVPVGAVLLAGIGAQFVDDIAFAVLPPTGLLFGWLGGVLAVLLTGLAARYASRDRTGAGIARTGLAVGAVSALIGLVVGDFDFVGYVFAALTMVAGVAGAVVGRRSTATD